MNREHISKKEKYIALVFMILTVIFWGYSFISTKIVLRELPPISIAFFRQIIAAVTLFIWLFVTRTLVKPTLRHALLITASAFFGIVLYFIFENTGLQYTSASSASIIVAAVPLFTLATEVLFFKLKVNTRMVVCILLSILGVYMVISINGKLELSSSSFKGNLLMIGAMVAWVAYTTLNKSLSGHYSGVVLSAYQALSGIFLFIPFIRQEAAGWKMISISSVINLLYLGIFCSALAYFFYIYATRVLGATVSSVFLNLIPVVSVISGFFVLKEKLQLLQIAGMVLIIFSLYILSRKPKVHRTETDVKL